MADLHRAFQIMSEDLGRLVDDFFLGRPPFFASPRGAFAPPTDIFETESEILVRVEIPGIERRDIHVALQDDCLAVSGERKGPCETGAAICGIHRKEIHYGPFVTVVRLPGPADAERARATYESGFVVVRLPKRTTPPERRSIPIDVRF
jgi:HSP20 family protein